MALACLVGIFGVIALITNPFKSSAADDEKPLHSITVNNRQELEEKWNAAVTAQETNTKMVLSGNVVALDADAGAGFFGSGAGFNDSGSIYVPAGFKLEIDLDGWRIEKGGILLDEGSVIVNDGTLIISDSNQGGKNEIHEWYIRKEQYTIKGGTIMTGNTLGYGGGIYNRGILLFNAGNIVGSVAETSGGAIATAPGAETTIKEGTFIYNYANASEGKNGGGALALLGKGATMTIENAHFANNQASSFGGAIFAAEGSVLKIKNITMTENNAIYGGALASAGDVTVERAAVAKNTARYSGGAFHVFGGELNVNIAAFENNTAQQEAANGEGDGGGAIAVTGGTLKLNGVRKNTNTSNITFVYNTARFGGAIVNNGGKVEATGIVVASNNATHPTMDGVGAGVANLAGTSNYTDSYFIPGNAKTAGSSLFVSGGAMNIIGGAIENHTNAVAALGGKLNEAVLNFTGDVTLQYNTKLVECWNNAGGTVNFNGAKVHYNGYASATEVSGNSGTTPEYIIGAAGDNFAVNFYQADIQYNRASKALAVINNPWVIGSESGENSDVVFSNNKTGMLAAAAGANYNGTIHNGTFINNTTNAVLFNFDNGQGVINIHGGNFDSNNFSNATGVSLMVIGANGDLTIDGDTTFKSNTVRSVVILAKGAVTINNGTFTGNTNSSTSTRPRGSVLYLESGASAVINGGEFRNNKSQNGVGGVIYAASGSQLTLTSGTFTNNEALAAKSATTTVFGGAIYSDGEVMLSGAPIIMDNTVGTNKLKSNLYAAHPIQIIGILSGNTKQIGLSMKGRVSSGWQSKMVNVHPRNYFFSDFDGYTVGRVDSEVVVATEGTENNTSYAPVPTKVNAPTYNGSAQTIVTGYASGKMQLVSITHTLFTEEEQAKVSEQEDDKTELTTGLSAYISGGNIIATAAGKYEIKFRLVNTSVLSWLYPDGKTTQDEYITVESSINKAVINRPEQSITLGYTGAALETYVNYKPSITGAERAYLKDWTIDEREDKRSEAINAGTYSVTFKPEYQDGAARNYYVANQKVNLTINKVDINTDKNFVVDVKESTYNEWAESKPDFDIYYRNTKLGTWNGTESKWTADEEYNSKFGEFSIKDVKYANNHLPSSADNQPTVYFAIDNATNFVGGTIRNFVIKGNKIFGADEEPGEDVTDYVKIVGKPVVTTTKVYDGTNSVAVDWRDKVSVQSPNGTLTLASVVATYNDANVGTDKTITVRFVFGGPDAYLYNYSYTINECEITALTISAITGITTEKVYNGKTDIGDLIFDNAEFVGKLAADNLGLTFATQPTFANADAGENKQMVISTTGLKLSGDQAGNYVLAKNVVVKITGTITPAYMTATATSYDESYDGEYHDVIKYNDDDVKLADGATQADKESIKWEFSLDEGEDKIWETKVPRVKNAVNIPVYFRVTANNHETFYGEVRFALSSLDINNVDLKLNLGQENFVYNGKEQNINPMVTAKVGEGEKEKVITLKYGEDYTLEYQNDYTDGEGYDDGFGDIKHVGKVTITVIGLGNGLNGTWDNHPTFNITPYKVALPEEDKTIYYYNEQDQTYQIFDTEYYTIEKDDEGKPTNVASSIGDHDVVISLNDPHNTVWANGETDDLHYTFTIYGAKVEVDWSWKQSVYYVGNTYTLEEALSATAHRDNINGEVINGKYEFLTADGKLTITDPNNAHFLTPDKTFDFYVRVKFTPENSNYSPVEVELAVPAKWIRITYNSNTGNSSANSYGTYRYNDAVVFIDSSTNESKLTRNYYTHVGWTTEANFQPLSARDLLGGVDGDAFKDVLNSRKVLALNGETMATADVTYYAVWCYIDYEVKFYVENPTQYNKYGADGNPVVMKWTDAAMKQFVELYNGRITYDEVNKVYTYTFNHGEWTTKTQNTVSLSAIQWENTQGFEFVRWNNADGVRATAITALANAEFHAQWQGRTYTVTFVNGDTTLSQTSTVVNGKTLTQAPTVSEAGRNFAGWFYTADAAAKPDDNGIERVVLGETVVWTTSNLTLYAGWTDKEISLQIEQPNGLTVEVYLYTNDTETTRLYNGDYVGAKAKLKIQVTKHTGYDYKGTMISVNGSWDKTFDYNDATFDYEVNVPDTKDQLYVLTIAARSEAIIYTIIYDGENAEARNWKWVDDYTRPDTFTIENEVTLPTKDKIVRTGYSLLGWSLSSDEQGQILKNTRELNAEALNSANENKITLYPKWTPEVQNIVLYNGGKAYKTEQMATEGMYTLIDLSSNGGYEDYTFLGWTTNADLSGEPMRAGTQYQVKPENNNLYAVWKIETEGSVLTANASAKGAWYNYGATVITITPSYSKQFATTRTGIKLEYSYTFVDANSKSHEVFLGTDGVLNLANVSETGTYTFKVTISDDGYSLPVTITAEAIPVTVWAKSIETNLEIAQMDNQSFTGLPIEPALPTITLEGHILTPEVDFIYQYLNNTEVGAARLKITGMGNYTGTFNKVVFNIVAADMTASATAYVGTYDGTEHALIVSKEASMDGAEGLTWTFSLTGALDSFTESIPVKADAGIYTVYYRVSLTGYRTVEGQVTVEIAKKEITVNWVKPNFTYNTNKQKPTATAQSGIDNDNIELDVSVEGDEDGAIVAGDHVATAVIKDETMRNNYELTNPSYSFNIAKAAITVTISVPKTIQRVGQDGGITYPTAEFKGILESDKSLDDVKPVLHYALSATPTEMLEGQPEEQGSYLVIVTIANPNYVITGVNSAPFAIWGSEEMLDNYITIVMENWVYGEEPSVLDYQSAVQLRTKEAGEYKEYDEEGKTILITYYRWVNNNWQAMEKQEITKKLAAGRYQVKVVIKEVQFTDPEAGGDGYGRKAAEATHEFNVLPRTLELTWSDLSHVYDGNKHEPSVTLGNFVEGDDHFELAVITKEEDGRKVGRYTATVAQPTNTNYQLPTVSSQEYTITRATLVVKINDQTQEYNNPSKPALTVELEGEVYLLDNEDGSVYTITREAGDNAGTYKIMGTSTNKNYAVTFVSAVDSANRNYGIYTITQQKVTVIWDNDAFTYNGVEQAIAAHIMDDYTDAPIQLKVEAYQGEKRVVFKNAGIYKVIAIDASGNYNLNSDTNEITIAKKDLTIKPDDLNIRYGEEFNLTATFTGFVNGENESVLTGGKLTVNYKLNDNITGTGDYPITADGYTNPNYNIHYETGNLHVDGISMTIKIKNQTSVYGDTTAMVEDMFEFVDESFINWPAIFTIETAANENAGIGEYAITGRILNKNYSIKFVNERGQEAAGVYTITPRAITVKIKDVETVYGGAEAQLTVDVAFDAIIGDDNTDGSVFTLKREEGINAGNYKITGTSTNKNYAVKFVSYSDASRDYGIYHINFKSIAMPKADATTYYYDGNDKTYNTSTWMNRSFYTISGTALNAAGELKQRNAGTYTIILKLDPNCKWENAAVGQEHADLEYKFIINKADFRTSGEDVVATMYKGIYDGKEHDALTIKNPINNTQFIWQFSTDNGKTFSTEMPKFKTGTHRIFYKVTSQNYNDSDVYSESMVISARNITVVIGANTVEVKKGASLTNFEVTGLADGDNKFDVIELIFLGKEYNPNTASVGDVFKLDAILREAFADCYNIAVVQEGTLTVVEAAFNPVPIVIGVVGAVVAIGGGVTVFIIIKKRKKKAVAK